MNNDVVIFITFGYDKLAMRNYYNHNNNNDGDDDDYVILAYLNYAHNDD